MMDRSSGVGGVGVAKNEVGEELTIGDDIYLRSH
jgi:hypothetical protein